MIAQYTQARLIIAAAALVILNACQHDDPGIEVRTVKVVREVQKPCPGTVPQRPAPMGAIASTAEAALAQALAKLAEWSGDGKYGDQAEAYFATCPPV